MSPAPPTVAEILDELKFEDYITKVEQRAAIKDKCEAVLKAQTKETYDQLKQTEETLEFIKALWAKYDCKEIATIYADFVKIQEALFGLERDEEKGERYRDHFIHMFNCFIFGLRLISRLLARVNEGEAGTLFKIERENLRAVDLPFGEDYTYKQRLFYLWTLISTFHDIAIPFQHLTRIAGGVNKFVEQFGWVFADPAVSMRHFDASQLKDYFTLLASIYSGGLKLKDSGRVYTRGDSPYLIKLFGRQFDRMNHGVLSGFFMWKTVEETFLVDRSAKYQMNELQFNKYATYVLQQDIARAALAISLHGLDDDNLTKAVPKVFPIRFADFPLAYILILADETQEYLRWEGTSIRRDIRFTDHPAIGVQLNHDAIQIKAAFGFDRQQDEYIIDQVKKFLAHHKKERPIPNIKAAIEEICSGLKMALSKKLKFDERTRIEIAIYRDWEEKLSGFSLP